MSVLRNYIKPPESNLLRSCLTKGTFSPCDEWPLIWTRHLVTEPELVVKGNDIPYCHQFYAVGSVVWFCLFCGRRDETQGLMHAHTCSMKWVTLSSNTKVSSRDRQIYRTFLQTSNPSFWSILILAPFIVCITSPAEMFSAAGNTFSKFFS